VVPYLYAFKKALTWPNVKNAFDKVARSEQEEPFLPPGLYRRAEGERAEGDVEVNDRDLFPVQVYFEKLVGEVMKRANSVDELAADALLIKQTTRTRQALDLLINVVQFVRGGATVNMTRAITDGALNMLGTVETAANPEEVD